MASRAGKICLKSSALFLCDMQEHFRKTIQYYPQILAVSKRMLQAARLLELPVVVTEQHPKGLGSTVAELDVADCPVFPKTQFSMLIPEVEKHMKTNMPDLKSVVLCGIESHICVQQTVVDLLDKNFDVHVIVDAVSSRTMVDRMYALERVKEAGAFLSTSEMMLFQWLNDANHPKFKEVQQLTMETAPDSGLLTGNPDPTH